MIKLLYFLSFLYSYDTLVNFKYPLHTSNYYQLFYEKATIILSNNYHTSLKNSNNERKDFFVYKLTENRKLIMTLLMQFILFS